MSRDDLQAGATINAPSIVRQLSDRDKDEIRSKIDAAVDAGVSPALSRLDVKISVVAMYAGLVTCEDLVMSNSELWSSCDDIASVMVQTRADRDGGFFEGRVRVLCEYHADRRLRSPDWVMLCRVVRQPS